MKLQRIYPLSISIAALFFTVPSTLQAAAISWTGGGDASGAWEGTASTFNGQAYTAADDLSIDGTATKTITLSGTIINPNSLTISGTTSGTDGYVSPLGSPGTGAITLTGSSVGGTLLKTGNADLVLASANTFSAVTISSGKVFLNDAAGLGTTGTLNINNGAAGASTGSFGSYGTGINPSLFVYDSSNLNSSYTFSKNIAFGTVASATTYGFAMRGGSSLTTTLSGNITGASNVTFRLDTSISNDSTSIWRLSGDNSGFAGGIHLNRGRIQLDSAVSSGTGTITLATNQNPAGNLVFNFTGGITNNITVTTASDAISTLANNATLTGVLSSAVALVKAGTGNLILANASNTLSFSSSSALTISDGTLTVAGAGRLHTSTFAGNVVLTASSSVLENASSAGQAMSGVISGAGSFRKTGTTTGLTFSGANTYTGSTTINAGTLGLSFGTVTTNILPAASALILGGGTLNLTGTGTQTVNGLTTTANTASRVSLAASETLTFGALTSAGANSALNINTAVGGANATTPAVGTSLVVLTGQTAGNAINPGFTVTDAGGFGLATVNGSNQVVRLTTSALLPATGAVSTTDYRIDNNAGGAAAAGSSALTVTASEAANSVTVDTTTAVGTLTISPGQTLSSNLWNFGGTGTNAYTITGGTLNPAVAGGTVAFSNYNTTGAVTLSSVIADNTTASAVVFNGTGTTNLTTANTYTGGTTIGGGTVAISNATALGGSVNFAANATLSSTVAFTNNISIPSGVMATINTGFNAYTGVVSGAGAVIGSATTSLFGANTYTGGTTVTGGFYSINNDASFGAVPGSFSANNITVNGGSISTFGATSAVALNANRGLLLNAALSLDTNGQALTINGVISGAFGATRQGSTSSAGLILTALNTYTGKSTLFARGTTTINSIKNVGGGASALGAPTTAANGQLDFGTTTTSGTLVYTGIDATTDRVISLVGTTGGATLTQSGTGLLKFTSALTAPGTAAVDNRKTLTLSGSTAGTGEIAGNIVDSVLGTAGQLATSVTKSGTGTWVLSGAASTYTGATTASGGILAGTSAHAFGDTSGISIAAAGTLSLRGDASTSFTKTTGGAAYTVTTTGSGSTINVDQATVAGTTAKTMTIGSLGTSSTAASFQWNFSGGNSTGLTVGAVTGPVTTAAGAVTLSNSNTTGTTTLASYTSANTTGGETLTVTGAGNTTVTGAITPSATALALTKSGTGTLTLSGADTYTGITTVTAGLLLLNNSNALPGGVATAGGTSALLLNGGIVGLTAATGDFTRSIVGLTPGATQVGWTNGGTGGFAAFGGDRTVNFGGANASQTWSSSGGVFGGGLILSHSTADSTVTISNPIVLNGSRNVTVNDGSASVDAVFSGILSTGGSSLTKVGAGTLALTAANVYGATIATGTPFTIISAGMLQLGNGGNTGSWTSAGDIQNDGTFAVNRSNAVPLSNIITGTGAFSQIGTGTTTLSGNNTYTGPTSVNAGTLEISGSIGNGATATNVTVNNTGTLLLSGAGTDRVKETGGATVALAGGTIAFASTAGGGLTETLGALTLSPASTLDFGTGTTGNTLTFASATISTGFSLNVFNWSGSTYGIGQIDPGTGTLPGQDRLLFNTDPLFDAAQINFYSGANTSSGFLGTGQEISFGGSQFEIVPVPEPSSTALIASLALFGLVGFRERRRVRAWSSRA